MTTTTTKVPLFRTAMALLSLRDSGYSLAAALGEPIDNSLEANANTIDLWLEEAAGKKNHIHRIVIADDGEGMDDETLHHYLMIGFSTRYMSDKTIGKYGVGAKLAALNFGRRIDVWTRQDSTEAWRHVVFDLDQALEVEKAGEQIGISAPDSDPAPDDVTRFFPEGTGTVVVWSKVDRLEEGRHAADANELRVEVEKELARVFRRFLEDGIKIRVNGVNLLPHDPLFLMERTWANHILNKELSPGEQRHYPGDIITASEPVNVFGKTAYLTVTVHPREVVRKRGQGGDKLAKHLRVPENEGAISFMRMKREISYTNVPRIFPMGVKELDRFIGIEVSFDADMDQFFGVRNVKRGVEPHGELRTQIRKLLDKYLRTARRKIDDAWESATQETQRKEGEHAPITDAVKDANTTLPKSRSKPAPGEKVEHALNDLADDVGVTEPDARAAYLERIRALPFVIETVSFPGTSFIDIQHLGHQILIRLNRRHRFYKEMWGPISELSKDPEAGDAANKLARRSVEALTLMVVAYAKAESMDESPDERYGDLRNFWGQFLETLLGKVKDVV